MQIDADYIITAIEQISRSNYANHENPADRLAYQVGMLQSKIRELCYLHKQTQEEIKRLQMELIAKDSE